MMLAWHGFVAQQRCSCCVVIPVFCRTVYWHVPRLCKLKRITMEVQFGLYFITCFRHTFLSHPSSLGTENTQTLHSFLCHLSSESPTSSHSHLGLVSQLSKVPMQVLWFINYITKCSPSSYPFLPHHKILVQVLEY